MFAILTFLSLITSTIPLEDSNGVVTTYPEIFEAAFKEGTKIQQGEIAYAFTTIDLGKIKLKTGKIIACDPVVMFNSVAFTQSFPKGDFPVQLAIASYDTYQPVAFSRILFSEKPVVKWEFALTPRQKQIGLNDTTFYCYGVDAGMGIFIDEHSNKIFDSFKENSWNSVFVEKMERNNYQGFIHGFGENNIAIFSTGYGDGCYATYIGFDTDGKVCRLITDFGLISWWQ